MARVKFTPAAFDKLHPDQRKDAKSVKYATFERTVFDTAHNFIVVIFMGRGTKIREDFGGDLLIAMYHASQSIRACLYAANPAGRHIVLDRKDWPYWRKRFRLVQRPGISDSPSPSGKSCDVAPSISATADN